MKTDIYTKIILILIALALWGLLLKPMFVSENAVVDVNLVNIDGKRIRDRVLDVNIARIDGIRVGMYHSNALPVKINEVSSLISTALPVEIVNEE
jgi:hypothetical protein